MPKKIDSAGMWNIKGNPITHDGVALYSGRAIDASGAFGLDPNKLYPVYRPFDELQKACESFNGKPLINNHEMIGTDGNLTKPDDKNIGGTIYNVRPSEDQPGVIIADMTIFSEEIQDAIENGKVELSLGYWCKYRKESGEHNGSPYQFVQYDLEGNHIALVDNGRMGSGVRVFDHSEKILVFDSMEIPEMKNKKTNAVDGGEVLRNLVAGLLKGATDEMLAKCKDILDPKKDAEDTDDPKKDGTDNEPDPAKDADEPAKKEGDEDDPKKDGEDADEPKKDEGDEDNDDGKGEDEEPAKKDGEDTDEPRKAEDAAPTMKQMLAEFAKRESLYKAVVPHTGAFDHDDMTAQEVAKYAAKKMKIATQDGAEVACVENYLSGLAKREISVAQDSSVGAEVGPSAALRKHLGV